MIENANLGNKGSESVIFVEQIVSIPCSSLRRIQSMVAISVKINMTDDYFLKFTFEW